MYSLLKCLVCVSILLGFQRIEAESFPVTKLYDGFTIAGYDVNQEMSVVANQLVDVQAEKVELGHDKYQYVLNLSDESGWHEQVKTRVIANSTEMRITDVREIESRITYYDGHFNGSYTLRLRYEVTLDDETSMQIYYERTLDELEQHYKILCDLKEKLVPRIGDRLTLLSEDYHSDTCGGSWFSAEVQFSDGSTHVYKSIGPSRKAKRLHTNNGPFVRVSAIDSSETKLQIDGQQWYSLKDFQSFYPGMQLEYVVSDGTQYIVRNPENPQNTLYILKVIKM